MIGWARLNVDSVDDLESGDTGEPNAGVVSLFDNIFTEKELVTYVDYVRNTENGRSIKTEDLLEKYLDWRTYQFSDHYPMWVRLETDGSEAYLGKMLRELCPGTTEETKGLMI